MGNHLGPLPEASDGPEGQEVPVKAVGQPCHYLLFLLFLLASRKFYFFYLQVASKWLILLFFAVKWSRIDFSDDQSINISAG